MKRLNQTLKQLLFASLILVSIQAMAGEGDAPALSRQISNQLSFPEELIQPSFNEKVRVDFKMKPDGAVEVLKVYTNNKELKDHVMTQFGKMNFNSRDIDKEKIYRIDVRYRVI